MDKDIYISPCKVQKILLVSDLRQKELIPVFQESLGLRRFDLALETMVRPELASVLRRISPDIQIVDFEQSENSYEFEGVCAVLAAISHDLTARLALGLQDTRAAEVILQALWLGIPVFADFSVTSKLRGRPCTSAALMSLYTRYNDQIRELGVRCILPGEYLITVRKELLDRTEEKNVPEIVEETAQVGGRVFITNNDIMKIKDDNAEFAVPKGAVVTAYALDTARKRGITLRRG